MLGFWRAAMKGPVACATLVLGVFIAIHLHTLVLDQTVEPVPSAVFGNVPADRSRLLDLNPVRERRIGGAYTADPAGTAALYPVDQFILENWLRGEFPFWNPFVLSGLPLLADGYWQIFYPLNCILLIGERWWIVYSHIHLLLAAFFLSLLYYQLRPRRIEAVLAAIGSVGVGWLLLYLPMLIFISMIPWGILFLLSCEV